ncbi:MAG TPA: integrin alpha, partial [Flavobacteriales bacterium]|nr:integrin alpha [Flavobacteriales bacterium]
MKKTIKKNLKYFWFIIAGFNVNAQNPVEIPHVKSHVCVASSSNGGPSLSSGDNFGRSIAAIGDINNDGINDVAVGANFDNAGGTDAGALYICFMNTNGTVKSSPAPVKITEGTSGFQPLDNSDHFGSSVVGIGDLNGDGNEDIAVGASNTDTTISGTPYSDVGSVFILFLNSSGGIVGRKEITRGESGIPADSLGAGSVFGCALANLGDINGDGTNDIAVGAAGYNSTEGSVWILRMKTDGTVKAYKRIREGVNCPSFTLDANDLFGTCVAGPGDLNYDGKLDLVVGASGDDDSYSAAGAFYVMYLDTSGIATSKKKISYPLMSNYYFPNINPVSFGESVNVTDINEDGVVDLIAGIRTFQTSLGGFYFMVMDSSQNVLQMKLTAFEYGWNYAGPATGPHFGASLAPIDLGNTNNKTYVVGANFHNGGANQQGSFYTMTMDSLKFDYWEGTLVDGFVKFNSGSGNFTGSLANSDFFGIDVAAIGDLNNDGNDDLVVGAHGNDDG